MFQNLYTNMWCTSIGQCSPKAGDVTFICTECKKLYG